MTDDAQAQRSTILIVDDVPENLMVLGELLRANGYGVKAANSGAVALQYAVQKPQPDLVMLDIMMPGMDGYEVLDRLRSDSRTAELPVILVTALNGVDSELRGLELGAADYITKPIVAPIVLARVRNQLELKYSRDLLRDQNLSLETEVARRVEEISAVQSASARMQARLMHHLELILTSADEGIQGLDKDGVVNFINPAGAGMLGYERDELVGRNIHDLIHHAREDGTPYPVSECPLHSAVLAGAALHGHQDFFWRRDGSLIPVECSCVPILEAGELVGSVVTWQDVSERNRYIEQLERKSNFDDLTGLPNRNLLADRLGRTLESSECVAVLTLNLDRFKGVNDSLGRSAGDEALKIVAGRLSQLLASGDTLARVEGDEFIMVASISDVEAVGRYVQPVLHVLQRPVETEGRELVLSASIGIAVAPRDGSSADALLRNSAAAMSKAKVEGGQRFCFYTPAMNARALERLDLENGLRRAIDQGELVLHYQPQVDLKKGLIIGAEALVRWCDPRRGWIMPGDFIPLAEESGLIVPLGEWVMREACRQNLAWQKAGLRSLRVAVNLSVRQFVASDVVRLTTEVLRDTGLDPSRLELELTESAAMADTEAFIRATRRLKDLGVELALDDFGTGFSSLSYLRRFEIDRLKIDQSFVRDIVHDPSSASIAVAVIALAHNLNLAALAEGVETEAQLAFLRSRDCDELQGYYFSRPVPAEEFVRLLAQPLPGLQPKPQVPLVRTLLLTDDEPQILATLLRAFDEEDYRILTACSAMEALDLLAQNEVGVVVSDARMPEMDGAEFLRRVSVMHPRTVRIMLSGYQDVDVVSKVVNQGDIFRYLMKPWQDADVTDAVREAFRFYETRGDAQH